MLGFVQDFIAVMCLVGIGTFWWIRIVNNPANQGRKSRFYGSHLGPAYFTLFMIFNVLWTLFLFRGAVEARDAGTGHGYGKAAFVSYLLGKVLPDSTLLIGIGLIAAHRRDARLPDLRAATASTCTSSWRRST